MATEIQRARRIALVLATMSAITVLSLTYGFIQRDNARESRAEASLCEKQRESIRKLVEQLDRQNELLSDQLKILQSQGNPQ
jgi:hypothetical protein